MIAYNEDEAAVLRLHEEVVDAFNKPDLNKLLSLHTDNVVIMEAGMPAITGKAEVAKLFEKFQQQEIVLKLSFNIQEIEVFDKRAFVRGQVIKQTVYNDQAP